MTDRKYQHAVLAKQILLNPFDYQWSIQGFGMLRFYITEELRLHVWDSRYKVENVSGLHTHPWHFHSTVLCGQVKQHRYMRHAGEGALTGSPKSAPFDEHRIRCGVGGGLEGGSEVVTLTPTWDYKNTDGFEIIEAGGVYSQYADEIHLSSPNDGTVTLIQRETPKGASPDYAYVYVPMGEEWVSAEPRTATPQEVSDITRGALERWFSE